MNWEIAGYVVGGIFYLVGFFVAASSIDDDGPHTKDFREKYGKDLGLMLAAFHHAMITALWPAFLGVRFVIGVMRDSIRVAFGKKVAEKSDASS